MAENEPDPPLRSENAPAAMPLPRDALPNGPLPIGPRTALADTVSKLVAKFDLADGLGMLEKANDFDRFVRAALKDIYKTVKDTNERVRALQGRE